MDEFSLIDKYFKQQKVSRADVLLGIGDDGALLQPSAGQLLVLSVDSMIEGVHFPVQTTPSDLGYKALAVNLSDMAAMGAEPAWMSLALTLPQVNTEWLEQFTQGLFELAETFQVQLVGGDTTRGPLAVTIQIQGFIPPHQALCRKGAKSGDKIYVSGTLGGAGLGLRIAQGEQEVPESEKQEALQRLHRPTPRIELGILLRGFASAAIDISDGLLADLGHILKSSAVGAEIKVNQIPLSTSLQHLPLKEALSLALTAGDDYELCFTIPQEREEEFLQILSKSKIPCSCIGEIEKEPGLRVPGFSGDLSQNGYQHFHS